MRHHWLLFLVPLTLACGDKSEETDDDDSTGGFLAPDADGDGYGEDVDCNDQNPHINPGVEEACNSVDDNCDGQIDEGVISTFYPDVDKDGYGNENSGLEMCNIQPGLIEQGGDCDDSDASINPAGTEICDLADNNCDGQVDEGVIATLYRDEDGDGYGQDGTGTEGCPDGIRAEAGGDCDDFDAAKFPGAREICGDGIINDCDATESDAIAACTGEFSGGIVASLAHAFTGPSSGSYAGYAVDNAGDIDGDGSDEILVGAPNANSNSGAAYIVDAGAKEGALATAATATITGTAGGGLGAALAGGGDIDGDGYDDVIVTAYGTDDGFLFYGPVTGAVSDGEADAYFVADEIGGVTISNVWGGYVAQPAGDLNNDGYEDLIFGAPLVSAYDQYSGVAVIGYGPFEGDEFGSVSGIVGETYYAQVGISVAGLGDVNGDGYADVISGARYANIGTTDGLDYAGGAFLYYGPVAPDTTVTSSEADVSFSASHQFDQGGERISAAGDLNNDGFQDFLIAELDLFGDHTAAPVGRIGLFYGSASLGTDYSLDSSDAAIYGEEAGATAIASADMGDANGDGYDDIIIGAYGTNTNDGAAYMLFGPLTGTVDLQANGLKVMGEEITGILGYSVSSAGDFDGDSLPDLLVGAPEANGNGTAYVVPRVGTGEY